jgi:hypothetical protein
MAVTELDLKKLKVQKAQVAAARMGMELTQDERKDEIARIQKTIDVQLATEAELEIKIAEAEKALKLQGK